MSMSNLDKVTQKIYEKYHSQLPWETLTTEQKCASMATSITKVLNDLIEARDSGELVAAPVKGMNKAKIDALVMLSADVALRGLECMLRNRV
jgi:hypothetical protein